MGEEIKKTEKLYKKDMYLKYKAKRARGCILMREVNRLQVNEVAGINSIGSKCRQDNS